VISLHRTSGPLRVAILIAAIVAMLSVAMASGSAAHFHERSTGGQCDVCVTAHVVSLEARAVFHQFGAVQVHERLAARQAISGYQFLLVHSSFSRGLPSFTV
jgi:hypothetical protein